MKHVTVYREPDRYAGWPANYGIWAWGNEVVVGFILGHYKEAEDAWNRCPFIHASSFILSDMER